MVSSKGVPPVQANKATGRRPLVQACLDRRNWLFLPVVGVLVLGLLSMSGFWNCVKSDEVRWARKF